MSIRDIRQEEFAGVYIGCSGKGILDLCPRFGKIFTSVHILRHLDEKKKSQVKILVAYPDNTIKKCWQEELKRVGYSNPNIEYTTFLSLHKHKKLVYDMVIIDEIHLLSEAQIVVLQQIDRKNKRILGLTGTLSSWTERTLLKVLRLQVIGRYSIKDAVKEGVVTDYHITVKIVPLDNTVKNQYKKHLRTEKGQFEAYSGVISKLEREFKETFFLRLARMRIIQNSLAKLQATKSLLATFSKERVLIFCGLIKVAESLGCPVFHSKSKDKKVFDDFTKGKGNHLSVVKIGNTGVTYSPLNKVIVNYFNSNSEDLAQKINRAMGMEYAGKKADIWIISSDEEVEIRWLQKALEFFDETKITVIR